MIQKKRCIVRRWVLWLTTVCVLLVLAWSPLLTHAGPPLPPRDKPPSVQSPDSDDDDSDELIGAYIELGVQPAQARLWTGVQWQNNAGDWYDVEGWQGTLNMGGKKVWWVSVKDFGAGPFRWVVYESRNGEVVVSSESFYLPQSAGDIVRVAISL
jgi:hypothetical protein